MSAPSSSNADLATVLRSPPSSFSTEELGLARVLLDSKQEHLFAGWEEGQLEKKHAFFAQVAALQGAYPGGIPAYCSNARELLRSSAAGENPYDGYRPEVRFFDVWWGC